MTKNKDLTFSNYQEFDQAIDRICKEEGIDRRSINRSPYGTYIGDYVIKMVPIKPKSVADLKTIIHNLMAKVGEDFNDFDNPCRFFYRGYCLMKVKINSYDYLVGYHCGGCHPSNCTLYKEDYHTEKLDDF